MKRLFLYLIVLSLTVSCKEQNTQFTAKLINGSQHNITILSFKGGIVYTNDTLKLLPNQSIEISNGVRYGLSTGPGFSSRYFGGPSDSIIIFFDNQYRVSHYANTPSQVYVKHYLFSSLRNIGNPNSYKFQSTKVSKYANSNTHEYTFTEEDYLYAK